MRFNLSDDEAQDEGRAEKIDGKVQKKVGQIGKVFGR